MKNCLMCKIAFEHKYARYCTSCIPVMKRLRKCTMQIVANAIKKGKIAKIDGQKCMDCGNPAEVYDHRDYGKPLCVDPVCRGCNVRRGSAIGFGWRGEKVIADLSSALLASA